jgi:flagellar basal-body rod protein FlgC
MPNSMNVFDIAGRAMSAQLVRLNTTASNLANAGSISGSEKDAFRALKPIFRAIGSEAGMATVQVDRVIASDTQPTKRYEPNHPLADANGDVWEAGVDSNAEMVEMIEAARQYQNNVQVLETAKSLILDTIRIGR